MVINLTAYVRKGRLVVIGVCDTPFGRLPSCVGTRKMPPDVKDGPIAWGAEAHPAVAMTLERAKGPLMANALKNEIARRAEEVVDRARAGDQNAMAVIVCARESAKAGSQRAKLALDAMIEYAKGTLPNTGGADFGLSAKPKARVSDGYRSVASAVAQAARTAKDGDGALHYGATISGLVPGVGNSTAALLGAASAIASGVPVTPEVVKGAVAALPGGESAAAMKEAIPGIIPATATAGQLLCYAMKNAGTSAPGDMGVIAKAATPEGRIALRIGYALGMARRLQYATSPEGKISAISASAAWELGE